MNKQIDSRELSEKTRLALARAKDRGVILGSRERLTSDQRDLIVRMASNGETISAMAEAVGFSVAGMSKWLDRYGLRKTATRGRQVTFFPTETQQPSEQSPDAVQESARQPEPSPLLDHPREQIPEPESAGPKVDLSWRP
jgi:hypothetical protein